MIEIRRLNMDNSWQIWWQGTSILLDPWLIGSEVDGFSWFNEQWHATEPVSLKETGHNDIVIVSQPYSDHCHAETIRDLMPYQQIMAVKPAKRRLEREIKGIQNIEELPDAKSGWLTHGQLKIAKLTPDKWIDPIYHAIVIRSGDDAIFYAPHGFELNEAQLKVITTLRVKLLMTTFSFFKIPAILGGTVNPGMAAVRALADQLKPDKIVNTHDEQKIGKGLIMKIAKTKYADIPTEQLSDARILYMDGYKKVRIDT